MSSLPSGGLSLRAAVLSRWLNRSCRNAQPVHLTCTLAQVHDNGEDVRLPWPAHQLHCLCALFGLEQPVSITRIHPLRRVAISGHDGLVLAYETDKIDSTTDADPEDCKQQYHAIWVESNSQMRDFYKLIVLYHTGDHIISCNPSRSCISAYWSHVRSSLSLNPRSHCLCLSPCLSVFSERSVNDLPSSEQVIQSLTFATVPLSASTTAMASVQPSNQCRATSTSHMSSPFVESGANLAYSSDNSVATDRRGDSRKHSPLSNGYAANGQSVTKTGTKRRRRSVEFDAQPLPHRSSHAIAPQLSLSAPTFTS